MCVHVCVHIYMCVCARVCTDEGWMRAIVADASAVLLMQMLVRVLQSMPCVGWLYDLRLVSIGCLTMVVTM